MKILIIDNSVQIIARLKELLIESIAELTIKEACTYEDAIYCIEKFNPEIILLDINLPNNQSFDIVKISKSIYSKTVIIVLSIFLDEQIQSKYTNMGADFFIDKYKKFEAVPKIISQIKMERAIL